MIVVVGDAHLCPQTWASMPQIRGDAYRSFEQTIRSAVDNKADAFILAGDILDTNNPPMEAVEVLLRGIAQLSAARIPVYAIPGNHDPDLWAGVSGMVTNLDEVKGSVGISTGLRMSRIAGIRSLSPEPLKERLATLSPDTEILVMHQLLKGLTGEFDGHQIWNLDPEWVPKHVKLVLMGDLHEAKAWDHEHSNGVTKFIYTGSTYMTTVVEDPEKSFLHVTEHVTGKLACERIKLSTRPFVKMVFLDDPDGTVVQAFWKSLQEDIEPDSLVLVKYDPRIPDVEKRLREGNDHVHFMFKPICIEAIDAAKEAIPPGEVSLASCLSREVDPQKDPFVYSFILDLLKGKETKEVIDEYRRRVMEEARETQPSENTELLPAQST